MGATTRGDLSGLFDDLPRLEDEPAPPPSRRRRAIPFLILVALLAVAAGSTLTYIHLPWLLFVLVGFFFWHRSGHFRHHHAQRPATGSSGYEVIG
jgi:hypothetical protein